LSCPTKEGFKHESTNYIKTPSKYGISMLPLYEDEWGGVNLVDGPETISHSKAFSS
jgi:hypothetical protein